ncbi:MAG: outer membrane beta-barrel protein [Bacteroidales bacterium]|nr:outer membrane beta-barrel protein [Bacteroidales bacterium]
MRKISIILILTLTFCSLFSIAQSPSKVTIKSAIKDTSNAEVPFATVMLLNPKDSTLVNFTTSDGNGLFSFNNVRNIPYLLKISHVSYLPHQLMITASPTPINDLGVVKVKPISMALMEVVVKAAKAPLRIRGDTVEYDATTFKVPPGSTVEDLLRRLPGIEVDAEGNIKTQGKDVKRIFVDGKTFFGDDPKSVTKNLGAEAISKVQVYDEKSEQSKLTGVDDGTKEKAMNLELKEEFKKGSFGKATIAGGTDERWASRANYNRFNEKNQLSFIGYANNINQTGVNWEDYGEFKGQNAFNDYDNGDFGFNSSRGGMYFYSDDDGPTNRFDGRGFTKNFGAGTNYNFNNKKTKFNASYFYNQTKLNLDQYTFKQTFMGDSSFYNDDTLSQDDFRGNHTIASRYEKELDSNNILIVKANVRFSTSSTGDMKTQLFSGGEQLPYNRLSMNNSSDLNSWTVTSASIFRHRFKKKGRSFAISAGYNISQSDGTDKLLSWNEFFKAQTFTDQIRKLNSRVNDASQLKSSMLFTEPLSKIWYWESFYNFSMSNNGRDRQVRKDENSVPIEGLSTYYTSDVLYNRLGSSIRYSNKGLNVAAGAAAQQLRLDGKYAIDKEHSFYDTIVRTYNNWTPNVSASYQLPRNMWLSMNYSYEVNEPDISDLQTVPNTDNPLYRSEGNLDLQPERIHSVNMNFNYWNPSSFASVGIGGNYGAYDRNIVYNQWIEVIDTLGILTITKPGNVDGGSRLNSYFWSSFPVIKTKFTIDINGSIFTSASPAYVNDVLNETKSKGFNIDFGINLTPTPKLIVSISQNMSINNITYSIREEQNQQIRSYESYASIKWQFAKKSFFESNFNYTIYKNEKFGFDQDMPIWNGSVRRIFGKNNKIEVRLAAFDLLNKRVYISQYGSSNYIMHTNAPTLARYYMLSLTYNIKGFEDKLKKNNFW